MWPGGPCATRRTARGSSPPSSSRRSDSNSSADAAREGAGDLMSSRPGVAIVRAGPAGLVVAHLLQREGIPFVVFERQALAELARRPKAGLVEFRTVQLLAREGIAGSILEFTSENHRSEFRTPDESVLLEYAALTSGRPHYIYPQHELVQRLCEALTEAGGEVRFGHAVRAVTQDSSGVVLSVAGPDGEPSQVRFEAAVGCDGSSSLVSAAMTEAQVNEQLLPGRFLVMVAAGAPLEQHTIYAAHPRGFAGQMRRGPAQTRYYLEIPGSASGADWPGRPGRRGGGGRRGPRKAAGSAAGRDGTSRPASPGDRADAAGSAVP